MQENQMNQFQGCVDQKLALNFKFKILIYSCY